MCSLCRDRFPLVSSWSWLHVTVDHDSDHDGFVYDGTQIAWIRFFDFSDDKTELPYSHYSSSLYEERRKGVKQRHQQRQGPPPDTVVQLS